MPGTRSTPSGEFSRHPHQPTRSPSRNAYVVDATEFVNFKRGTNFYPLYSRRRVSKGRFEVSLDRKAGPYYFILSNTFPLFTDKWVEGAVELTY